KNVGVERAIKIGGGRETVPKIPKEPVHERVEQPIEEASALREEAPLLPEGRLEKKRGRRHYRRRRGREEVPFKEGEA
ncbi:hypothetical protein OFC23_32910, partial [Escherichia coli]|nr:hypothetical protein [Escherichia coli]